jgi:YD repeat-containing protein
MPFAAGSRTVAYQYDLASNRTRLTYPDSTYITYGYDQLGQLRRVKNQAGTILAQYSYDGRSRRTALDYANGAGMDYSYDTASRLLSLDNSTNSGHHEYEYTYDKVGNRTTMSVTDSSGTEQHVYNNAGTHYYHYDALGRRGSSSRGTS